MADAREKDVPSQRAWQTSPDAVPDRRHRRFPDARFRSALFDLMLERESDQLGGVFQPELFLDVFAVGLDGLDAQSELLRDLRRPDPLADEVEYLELPVAQPLQRSSAPRPSTIPDSIFDAVFSLTYTSPASTLRRAARMRSLASFFMTYPRAPARKARSA